MSLYCHYGRKPPLGAIPSPRAVTMERNFDRGFSNTPNEILNNSKLLKKAEHNEVFGSINQFVQINHF